MKALHVVFEFLIMGERTMGVISILLLYDMPVVHERSFGKQVPLVKKCLQFSPLVQPQNKLECLHGSGCLIQCAVKVIKDLDVQLLSRDPEPFGVFWIQKRF